MSLIFSILAAAAGLYSLLILVRIVISWFGGAVTGKPVDLLVRATDPYLDWWRRALNLRLGFLDLSPLAAVASLSVIQSIFHSISVFNRISIGNIIAIILLSIWSVALFILGFCMIIIILRLIAFISNSDIYGSFWRVIDSISQPLLYRTNRILFGKRIPNFLKGMITSILVLGAIMIGGGFLLPRFAGFLSRLPF
jgi:YggT family protein